MTDFKQILERPEYGFLRTNEHLGDNVILLSMAGSYAYGTNVEGSDIDVRGIATNRPEDLLCMRDFDHYSDDATDTTVFSFDRAVSMLVRGDPWALELLGCKPEHYLKVTPLGYDLIDNRKLFFSRAVADYYEGYAIKQLRRMQNAIARDRVSQESKEKHILATTMNALRKLQDQYPFLSEKHFRMYTDESQKEGVEAETFADIHIDHVPLRKFNVAMRDINGIFLSYDRTKNREHGKDDLHLNKHALHMVRAYLTVTDFLETGDFHTYRGQDRDLLLSIRNGKFMKDDKTYDPAFFDLLDQLKARFDYAAKHSPLPSQADMKKVREFVADVNRRVVCET